MKTNHDPNKSDLVEFTPEEVKNHLDKMIRYWRKARDEGLVSISHYYIDAFQSVRTSLFGEALPPEDKC